MPAFLFILGSGASGLFLASFFLFFKGFSNQSAALPQYLDWNVVFPQLYGCSLDPIADLLSSLSLGAGQFDSAIE
jgi:hypothetical protein